MFNRYWRDYPWFLQLVLFGLMAFTLVSFSGLILHMLMPSMTGYSVATILAMTAESSDKLKSAFLWTQGISSVFGFMLPPLLFAYLSHPRVKPYLGLKAPQQPLHILLAVFMMLGAMPVLMELASVLKELIPGSRNNAAQNRIEAITEALLDIKTPAQLVQVLIVMALIPAIGEELFFRGVLFRFAHQRTARIVLPMIITSVLFGAVHGTPFNFLSISIAGVLLCVIYYWSGSLLTGMIAHFVYNGTQIYIYYLSKENAAMKEIAKTNQLPVSIVLTGAVVFLVALFAFWKTRKPLPQDWSANFSKEELAQQTEA